MAFKISDFRGALVGDGARSNLFNVSLVFPQIVTGRVEAAEKATFLVRSAQLPGSEISSIPLNYFGREIKFPGVRRFPDWTVTIINDEDFRIRNAFELWMTKLNSHSTNVRDVAAVNSEGYSSDLTIYQYGKSGDATPIKAYQFIGAFPTDVTPIDMDWGSDGIEEFSVTFSYQYWIADGASGTTPDEIATLST